MFVKSRLDSFTLNKMIHVHNTRSANKIHLNFNRLTHTMSSYQTVGVALFNKLPISSHNVPIERFKKSMSEWLAINPFYKLSEFFACDKLNINF